MPAMETYIVNIDFTEGPSSDGTITGTGSATFNTNVQRAAGSLHNFTSSFGEHQHRVLTFGASVDSVQFSGAVVTVKASLRLENNDGDTIDKDSARMAVQVVAWCE